MPRVPWHLFQHRQREAHLVVGVGVQTDRAMIGDELRDAQSVLTRFVNKQRLSGDYAATVVRDGGRPECDLERARPASYLRRALTFSEAMLWDSVCCRIAGNTGPEKTGKLTFWEEEHGIDV